jgi:hypothetical protein
MRSLLVTILAALVLYTGSAFGQEKKIQLRPENYFLKYTAASLGLFVAFSEGCEQGYFFQDRHSKWPHYTKDNSHVWFGARRVSMVGAGFCAAGWHPKQKFLSVRTAMQYISYCAMYSWTMNRGLRIVQTGELFPREKGHDWYVDLGFFRFDVKSEEWMQWTTLGVGAAGLLIDALWNVLYE